MVTPKIVKRTVATALGPIECQSAGEGTPLLVLHRDTGVGPALSAWVDLATDYNVIIPSLPGYDGSARCGWMRSVPHLAHSVARLMDEISDGRFLLAGSGFGGWVTAQVMTTEYSRVAGAVLVAPMGLKPRAGSYLDQFLISSQRYFDLSFADPANHDHRPSTDDAEHSDRLENNRETTTRLAWKPYMYDAALAHLLPAVPVPSLILHGTSDHIVPISVSQQYEELLPHAQLQVVEGAGHQLEAEDPLSFGSAVLPFLSNLRTLMKIED